MSTELFAPPEPTQQSTNENRLQPSDSPVAAELPQSEILAIVKSLSKQVQDRQEQAAATRPGPAAELPADSPPAARPSAERKSTATSKTKLTALGIAALAIAAAVLAFATSGGENDRGTVGGIKSISGLHTEPAKRAPLEVVVTTRGTIDSSDGSALTSKVEWRTRIIHLVPEGSKVKEGDVVCELDRSNLEEKFKERQIHVTRAEASLRQARENFELQKLINERNVAAARMNHEIADLDLKKFRDGEFPQQQKTLQSQITLARETLTRAQATYDYVKRVAIKGYKTQDDVEKARIELVKAKVAVRAAEEKESVYNEFTYDRTITELEHSAEEMARRLDRAKSRAELALLQAEASVNANERSTRIHRDYLKRLERNLEACTIRAPHAGEVVYANEDRDDDDIEIGKEVRYRQAIVELPDLSQMGVETRIHESHISDIREGLPVTIRVDAYQDAVFRGRVTSVASVPAQTHWSQPDLKEFDAVIQITKQPDESIQLKPGLTAEVEIQVDKRNSVLQVPVNSVVEVGGEHKTFVMRDNELEIRRVQVGKSDEFSVEILGGLDEGERVVVSPRTYLAAELAELDREAVALPPAPAIGD